MKDGQGGKGMERRKRHLKEKKVEVRTWKTEQVEKKKMRRGDINLRGKSSRAYPSQKNRVVRDNLVLIKCGQRFTGGRAENE
jgi:hypothetical protein